MQHWSFDVIHQDQSKAHGARDMDGPGIGRVAIVKDLECSCDHKHTLIGTEHMKQGKPHMSGAGINSVSPPNDTSSKSPKGAPMDDIPSWEGGPSNP